MFAVMMGKELQNLAKTIAIVQTIYTALDLIRGTKGITAERTESECLGGLT